MRRRLRSEGFVLVPALPAIALFVYWGAHEGGYLPTTWGVSALLVLGLLAATVAGLGLTRIRLARPVALALVALAAYVAWSYLSIAWAAAPGDALEGSNRALLFLLLFALFAVLPWRAWTAYAALSAFALGVGGLAVAVLVRLGSPADVRAMFIEARLSEPLGYVNATPALFTMAALVAIGLGARRELPPLVRAALLAAATAGLHASVLSESRGWLFSLPVVAVATVAVAPNRVRLVLWSLPPIAGGVAALPALLDVYQRTAAAAGDSLAASQRALADAAAHAGTVALAVCAAVFVATLGLALLDRRVAIAPRDVAQSRRVGRALVAVAAVAALLAGLAVTDGRPDRALADYWDRSSGYQALDAGSSRFSAVGSNRPDFYRVALAALRDRPLTGLGQDNWASRYLRERRSDEEPRWVHSLPLRLVAHTGIVGFALFATFLVAALVGALSGRRDRTADAFAHAAAAAALAPLIVWVVHGSIDWFWEIPALSGPAFAFLGVATAVARRDAGAAVRASDPAIAAAGGDRPAGDAGAAPATSMPARPARHRAAATAGVLLAAALAVALALPYLAERDVARAGASWAADPAGALKRLDRAAQLNALSAKPDLTAGVIALELDRPAVALQRFDRAVARAPQEWFAHFGRGLAHAAQRRPAAARAEYLAARRLSPSEPLLDEALRRVGGRRPLLAREAFAILRARVDRLTGESERAGAP